MTDMLCHVHSQKLHQRVPELEKSTAVAVEKMRLEEAARRKLEDRLITVRLQAYTACAVSLSHVLVLQHACTVPVSMLHCRH